MNNYKYNRNIYVKKPKSCSIAILNVSDGSFCQHLHTEQLRQAIFIKHVCKIHRYLAVWTFECHFNVTSQSENNEKCIMIIHKFMSSLKNKAHFSLFSYGFEVIFLPCSIYPTNSKQI